MGWTPTPIDTELEFTRFVPTFRDGQLVRKLLPDQPAMVLNADFLYRADGVVVELKCLETDSSDGVSYSQRLVQAFTHFGYTGSELFGYLYRGDPMPPEVSRRLGRSMANPLRNAMRKANKQIAATKRHLVIPNARGLVLFANNGNYGFRPQQALSILSEAVLHLSENHVDGFVYFTPNVYHDIGDDIARTLWTPPYAVGKEDLADFVNPFGRAWIDYYEQFGEPFVDRQENADYTAELMMGTPIKAFRPKAV